MRPEFTDGLPPHHQRILISGQRVPLPKFSREMQVAFARACAHALVRASRPPPARAPAVRTTRVRCVSFCLCSAAAQESVFCFAPVGWTLWTYRFFEVCPGRCHGAV